MRIKITTTRVTLEVDSTSATPNVTGFIQVAQDVVKSAVKLRNETLKDTTE